MPIILLLFTIVSAVPRSQIFFLWLFSCLMYLFILYLLSLGQIIKKLFDYDQINRISFSAIILVVLAFAYFEGNAVRQQIKVEPAIESYTTDSLLFLKTFYLISQGEAYHRAFAQSYEGDNRVNSLPPDMWGFRFPTVFYFWKIITLSHPENLYYIFTAYSILCLFLVYSISANFGLSKWRVLPVVLTSTYFLYGLSTYEFLHMEWWGILPMLVLIQGILTNKLNYVFIGSLLAPLIRETYALPIISILIYYLFCRKYAIVKAILFSGLLCVVFTVFHAYEVFKIIPFSWDMIFRGRQHFFTFELIRQVLVYGTWKYFLAPFKVFTIYIGLSIFSYIYLKFNSNKNLSKSMPLWLMILPTLLFFTKIGLNNWGDYWGLIVSPFIPLLLGLLIGLMGENKRQIT